jgi:PAS domain S-box-containing protein
MYLVLEGNDHDPKALQKLLRDHGYTVSLRSGDMPGAAAWPETAEEGLPLAFLEHFIDGIVIMDVETVGVKYANKAFADMLGYSLDEIRTHKVWDWDVVWSREDIEQMYATRNWLGEHFETRLRRKDGQAVDVSISHKSMTWRGEEVVFCAIEDISERKKTERLLQHAQFTLDKAIDQVFWTDVQGNFYYVNEAACASLGYSREELLTMSVMDIDPHSTLSGFQANRRHLQKHGTLTVERQHRDKDGRIYPVEIRANLLVFDGQEYYCAFATDISERKQKEKELRLSQFALDNTADQAFWITPAGRIVYANPAACASLNYGSEELVGMSLSDIDPDCSAEKVIETWESLKAEKTRRFEGRHKARDGRIYPVEVRSNYVNVDGQEFRFAFATDISDRKAAEEALKCSEARYRQLMEMLPIAVYTTDADGRITFFNRKAKEFWQREPNLDSDRWCGSFKLRYPDGQLMTHDSCPMARTVKTGETCQGQEIIVQNPDGSCSHALAYPALLGGVEGTTEGAVNLLLDITERKRTEEALEKRLVALTRPLDDAAGVTFDELFNLSEIQRLQDDFAQATGVASLITLPDGTPLTEPSNFCRFCNIIRRTEKGFLNCMKSDEALGRPSVSGPRIQQCLSGGLWGAGAAISVGGRHVASWLVGQGRDASVTEGQIRAYARKVGADEEAAVEAFREIPIMSRERVGQIARALYTLARQLSSIAYQNVQQARFITDYKRAEEARRKSECKYRSIVEHAPFGITRSTREGKLLSVNPALVSILKYDSVQELMETVNRSSIQDAFFPTPEERGPLVEKILAQDSWHVFNNRLRCKDGSIVTCRVHSRRISEEDSQAGEFESYQENITEQLAAEEALRESEEKFRVLAETSPVSVCLFQGDRHIYVNPAMERMFGYSAEELCRMKFWELAHDDYRELIRARGLARLAGQGGPGQYEFKYLTKKGEEGYVLISAGMLEYHGHPTGVASFLDITERKRTEQLIRASLEEKEVLLREIHHRVKNNLQVISSLLYLQSQKFSDEELQTCFSESQNRICSMALAHEQLYQSKNLAEVSIKTYLENLVRQQQQICPSADQKIDCRLAVEDIPLDIEKVIPCGLLITELLSNAYKHAFADGRNGQVVISLHGGAGRFELTVADDGIGLPAGFDHGQVKTLGLQLVSALVDQLNGTLELENGNGTCFRVRFSG